ncbi:hypothetical protein B0H11DRAFT_2238154 [Mycena galericulata]|nr:hypothetical protein B0H11DRAFT_2238154 [Mycena galericulata]
MFSASFGLLILAAVSVAVPAPTTPSSDVKTWTGEEALAAGLLKVIAPETLAAANSTVSRGVFSDQIILWNNPSGNPSGTGYDPGTFGEGFFFCVDLTLRDTAFNDQATSFFVATDTSCNVYINAGCTGTGITDLPTGNFISLTGIFFQSVTSLACEWLA